MNDREYSIHMAVNFLTNNATLIFGCGILFKYCRFVIYFVFLQFG